ncbi:MAG: response regulator [Chloroflexi bacterium]|nr:response regulator [Chloroflexota bacterium]
MTGKKILVVDADVASRNFIARTLQKEPHEIIQAGSGKEGLIIAWRDHPDLIIIEPNLPDLKGEDLASRLRADPRTARTPLVALSSDPTTQRMKSCRDAGFNEFIRKSGEAVSTLIEVIDRLFGSVPTRRQGGLLIVFLGGKGGMGTSSLCANLAMNVALNQPELRVAVADIVLPIGSIAPIVGYEGERNLVTVADLDPGDSTSHFFRDHLTLMTEWRFYLLAGAPDPEVANHLQVGRIQEIIRELRHAYDFVLVDLGRSLSRFAMQVIHQADLVALVIGTDASSVALTKTVLEYLRSRGMSDSTLYPILNRAIGLEGLSKPDVEKELGIEIKTAIPYLGSHFAMANNQHTPFAVKFPKDTAAVIFRECARQMVDTAKHQRSG